MKSILVGIIICFAALTASAQAPLSAGNAQLNLGVGFSGWGVPVYGGLDYAVDNDITIGAEVSYRSWNEGWHGYDYKHSITGICGNFNYHFGKALKMKPKWDLYGGVNIGFFIWSSPSGYEGDHTSGLGLGAQIGIRYALSRVVALNLEFGGGNAFSGGKFGLTIKL